MSYYKRTTTNETYYYNLTLDPIIMIVESGSAYRVSESDHDETWIKANAESMDEQDFNDKADDISDYARLGVHPPKPPGSGG